MQQSLHIVPIKILAWLSHQDVFLYHTRDKNHNADNKTQTHQQKPAKPPH